MARRLDYPKVCRKCGGLMPLGTMVEFDKVAGEWLHWHAEPCPTEGTAMLATDSGRFTSRKKRKRGLRSFKPVTLACSRAGCMHGEQVFEVTEQPLPDRCRCGSSWLPSDIEDRLRLELAIDDLRLQVKNERGQTDGWPTDVDLDMLIERIGQGQPVPERTSGPSAGLFATIGRAVAAQARTQRSGPSLQPPDAQRWASPAPGPSGA